METIEWFLAETNEESWAATEVPFKVFASSSAEVPKKCLFSPQVPDSQVVALRGVTPYPSHLYTISSRRFDRKKIFIS